MPGSFCSAINCINRGGFRFPKNDLELRRKWILATGRKNYEPVPSAILCKDHFDKDDIITINKWGLKLLRAKLKKDAVPKIFKHFKQQHELHKTSLQIKQEPDESLIMHQDVVMKEETIPVQESIKSNSTVIKPKYPKETKTRSVQTDCSGEWPLFSLYLSKMKNKPEVISYYTAFSNYESLMIAFSSLDPYKHLGNLMLKSLSLEDQFLLFLMKLKQNKDNYELSLFYNISMGIVENIIFSWIDFVYNKWSKIDIWPTRDFIDASMPKCFQKKFPKARVLLESLEVPITKPEDSAAQQQTFSAARKQNTLKVIVGITPGGLISFVSETYGGGTSDQVIIEKSDLFQKCEKGDAIMANNGMDVMSLFPSNDSKKDEAPAFITKKNELCAVTVTKKTNSVYMAKRDNVGKVNSLAKSYKILQGPLTRHETLVGEKIIFICLMLCNFRSSAFTMNMNNTVNGFQ